MTQPLFIYVFLITMMVFSIVVLIEPFRHRAPLHAKVLAVTTNTFVLWCFWHLLLGA